MRLLLTHGFFLGEDPKEQQVMRPYPPLGILYLSAYLRDKGFDVEIYDSTWGSKSELYGILERGPAGWLGVYGNLLTRGNVIEIVERARAAGWRIVLGGPEPANYAEEYLAVGADYVVQGEGELALEQLLSGNPAPDGTMFAIPRGGGSHARRRFDPESRFPPVAGPRAHRSGPLPGGVERAPRHGFGFR